MITKSFVSLSILTLSDSHNRNLGFIPSARIECERSISPSTIRRQQHGFGGFRSLLSDHSSARPSTSLVLRQGPSNHQHDKYAFNRNPNNDETKLYLGSGRGFLVLATVPMAWGTFEPAVRLVYQYEPSMPPLVFSFAYYLIATFVLTLIGALRSTTTSFPAPGYAQNPPGLSSAAVASSKNKGDGMEVDKGTAIDFFSGLPLSTRGGFELGTYLFIGNAFQVIGLKTVQSDRAAFLLQLTTIFVPLLKSWTSATEVPLQTWIACLVALTGVAVIGLDDGNRIDSAAIGFDYDGILDAVSNLRLPTFSVDDSYIVLAAVFYTFHCIRLETYARSAPAIDLATAKATTEMLWSGLAIAGCVVAAIAFEFMTINHNGGMSMANEMFGTIGLARVSGEQILSYVDGVRSQIAPTSTSPLLSFTSGGWPRVGLATVWVGAVTVAYTIYAQSFGQSRVTAVTANLIYSSQPIFTAVVAQVLLGESLGTNGYIGGLLIGVAVLLVIAVEAETDRNPAESMVTETDD